MGAVDLEALPENAGEVLIDQSHFSGASGRHVRDRGDCLVFGSSETLIPGSANRLCLRRLIRPLIKALKNGAFGNRLTSRAGFSLSSEVSFHGLTASNPALNIGDLRRRLCPYARTRCPW
jgi:hypothetical protein